MSLLGDAGHTEMVDCLKSITSLLRKPSAIVVVSAHWEEKLPTITAGESPSLIYDYYGFPEESYRITYPCKGAALLANKIREKLERAGIACNLDKQRGFDHGLFIPLKIMYPDAAEHISIGQALQGLDYENLLLIGSGFSFHNMKAFFTPETTESKDLNEAFESWLLDTCSNTNISEEERKQRLCEWVKAPGARFCHPREEHLLPLYVCYEIGRASCREKCRSRWSPYH